MRKVIAWTVAGLLLGAGLLGTPNGSWAQAGKAIFVEKCAPCHGETGKGNGPMASTFDPKPRDFCLPEFWQGDVDKKVTDAVTKGKNQMVPVDLKPDQMKAVIEYIKSSCKK
jgi:mono/diheme cytochrome c family protein